jgi:membrane protein implicated in regulation of membrane protease activity
MASPASTLDWIFIISGTIGGMLVLGRMAVLFFGVDLDGDDPSDFQILSLHGLSSFLLMFGLVGLALQMQSGAGPALSLLGGLVAGLLAVAVLARIIRLAGRLQSNGTLHSGGAEGCLGRVCLTIPTGGTGRVNVRIGQRLREMDAVHDGLASLPTGTPVRVVRVENNLAVVRPHLEA